MPVGTLRRTAIENPHDLQQATLDACVEALQSQGRRVDPLGIGAVTLPALCQLLQAGHQSLQTLTLHRQIDGQIAQA
jgi:response regulator of citrate/malate metabolism